VTALELRPSTSRAKTRDEQLVWPKDGTVPGDLHSDLNPWLTEFGLISDPLIDLGGRRRRSRAPPPAR